MKGSDTDIITLLNDIHIIEEYTNTNGSNIFVMRTCDTRPGFTQLELCSSYEYTDVWCKKIGQQFFLSSSKMKQTLMSLNKNNVVCTLNTIHGPCISTRNKTHDFTVGIKCRSFIQQAQEWVSRNRRWPTEALKKIIIDSGPTCTNILTPKQVLVNTLELLKRKHDRFILSFIFNTLCRNIGTRFTYQYVTQCENKLHYQILKEILPFVIMGVRSDAVSGWNYLATYYYCVRKYSVSLKITDYVLSKIKEGKQEKLYYSEDKFTIDYLPRRCNETDLSAIYIDNAMEPNDFKRNSFLIPDEMKHEVKYKGYIQKPPIVYTLFLRFISLLKSKKTQKCLDSLNDMKSFIETNKYIGNHVMKAECYTLLGIACYLKCDLTEAGNCHMKALALDGSNQFKYLKMIDYIRKEYET
ncbi:unnamed protein product [Mytilus edulis]|uniref:Mab-21-like HhH/H2TH-like domain-containing protein n=1 Tax=Mytilus edulis TaxID=6550 RepID=A0A8S3V6F0_MYTED|nr:unnamed protein product [Mytilus edulis]